VISIIFPTRGRPANVKRLLHSLLETSTVMPEVIVYVDDDDTTIDEVKSLNEIKVISGPRRMLSGAYSECWNVCASSASGDILMIAGDDLVFRTVGWDRMVEDAFVESSDKLIFVHGDDGFWGDRFGTHGFLHKNWIEIMGYFVPPYLYCDFVDTWWNCVADAYNRRVYLPFVTEHMHPNFGKAQSDQTYKDRIKVFANSDVRFKELGSKLAVDIGKLAVNIEKLRIRIS
jgi:glycosyltransferase involved in cell wall biosynthesis